MYIISLTLFCISSRNRDYHSRITFSSIVELISTEEDKLLEIPPEELLELKCPHEAVILGKDLSFANDLYLNLQQKYN